jgi:hypothetical protein
MPSLETCVGISLFSPSVGLQSLLGTGIDIVAAQTQPYYQFLLGRIVLTQSHVDGALASPRTAWAARCQGLGPARCQLESAKCHDTYHG